MAISQILSASLASGVPASSNMPTGSVLQVVNGTTNTNTSNSTNTWADTTLTATITPKYSTSKILVLVDQNGLYKDSPAAQGGALRLLRNGTQIFYMNGRFAGDSGTGFALSIGSASACYLDSPATTSAITYKTQFNSESNVSAIYVQVYSSGSSITLLEIAG